MGLGKKRNLILTAREDHHHRSRDYSLDGPRVHFDLEGYDLLLWKEDELEQFRAQLEQRIKEAPRYPFSRRRPANPMEHRANKGSFATKNGLAPSVRTLLKVSHR